MKKRVSTLLAALSIVSLVACGSSSSKSSSSSTPSSGTSSSTPISSEGGSTSVQPGSSDETSDQTSETPSIPSINSSESAPTSESSSSESEQGQSTEGHDSHEGSESSESSSSQSEEPGPIEDRIKIDMAKPAAHVEHAPISTEDIKAFLGRFLGEENTEYFLRDVNKIVDIEKTVNALGFSLEDYNVFADLVEFLGQRIDEEMPADEYFASLTQKLEATLSVFSADKFATVDNQKVSIHVLGLMRNRVLSAYNLNFDLLDTLISSASEADKADLIALRDYALEVAEADILEISSEELVSIGRLLEGLLKATLQYSPEFAHYTCLGLSGHLYRYGVEDAAEGTVYAKIKELRDHYNNNTAVVMSTIGDLLKHVDITAESFSEILHIYDRTMDESWRFSILSGGLGVRPDYEYEILKTIYDDVHDLIEPADLKVLFEFAVDIISEYTPEFEAEIRKAEKPSDLIIAKYDALYGALTKDEKDALHRIASAAGLDFDAVVTGLKGLADLQSSSIKDALKTIFKPVIDQYGDLVSPKYYYSTYSSYDIFYEQGTKPSAEDITARVQLYQRGENGSNRVNFTVELVGEPEITNGIGNQKILLKAAGDEENALSCSFHYFALPSSLKDVSIESSAADLGFIESLSDDLLEKATAKRTVNSYSRRYNAKTHEIDSLAASYFYTYADLDMTKGAHTVTLTGASNNGNAATKTFNYTVYDASDIRYALSYIGTDGLNVINGTAYVLKDFAPTDQIRLRLRAYLPGAGGKMITPNAYLFSRDIEATIFAPVLAQGEEKKVNVMGEEITFYRPSESDYESTELVFNYNSNYYVEEGIVLIPEGYNESSIPNDILYGAYLSSTVNHNGVRFSLRTSVDRSKLSLSGFDLAYDDAKVKTGTISYEGYSSELKYAVISAADRQFTCDLGYLLSVEQVAERYYHFGMTVTLKMDGVVKTVGGNTAASMEGYNIPFTGEEEYGDGEVTFSSKGITFKAYYHLIDPAKIETRASGDRSVMLYDETGMPNGMALMPYSLDLVYEGRGISGIYLERLPENADKTPGTHTATGVYDRYGVQIEYEYTYEVANDFSLGLIQYEASYFLQSDEKQSVYVSAYASATFEGKGYYENSFGSFPVQVDVSTPGEHILTIEEGGLSTVIIYYVYEAKDVTTSVTTPVQENEVTYGDSHGVEFNYSVTRTINLGELGTISNKGYYSYYYEIPEEDYTPGTHTATIEVEGQTYEVSYYIKPYSANWTINYINWNGSNVVPIGGDINIYSIELRDEENGRYADVHYNEGDTPSFEIYADTSAATNGWAIGHIIYQGYAFAFQYMVYDPQSPDIISVESYRSPNGNFVEGEYTLGRNLYWYSETYDAIVIDGVVYRIGNYQSQNYYHTLTEEDLTVGEHTVLDPTGASSYTYTIHGLDDPNVTILNATLNGEQSAYLVGEQPSFSLSLNVRLDGEKSYYIDWEDLTITGFDTSASTNGEKKTATVTFGSFSYSFDYLVYEESEITDFEYEYVPSPYYAESVFVQGQRDESMYFEGQLHTYGYLGGEKIHLSTNYLSFRHILSEEEMEIGSHSFTYEYAEGVSFDITFETIGQDDSRIVWDSDPWLDYYSENTYFVAVGSDGFDDIYVELYIKREVKNNNGGYYTYESRMVKLSTACPYLHDFDTSTVSEGETWTATFVTEYNYYEISYVVYDAEDLFEGWEQEPSYYLYGEWPNSYLNFAYTRYVDLGNGERHTFFSYTAWTYIEISNDFTRDTDISGTVTLTRYRQESGEEISEVVPYLIKCVTLEECDIERSLSINGTFYEGLDYEIAVTWGSIHYVYDGVTLRDESSRFDETIITIDTSYAGEHEDTIEIEGNEYTYTYTVNELPEIERFAIYGYDMATGSFYEIGEGDVIYTSFSSYAFVYIDSNWVYDGVSFEGDAIQSQQYNSTVYQIHVSNYENEVVLTNSLYPDFSFTFSVAYVEIEETDFFIGISPKDNGEAQWVEGNGGLVSNNFKEDGTTATMQFIFLRSGIFHLSGSVSSEENYDKVIFYLIRQDGSRFDEYDFRYSGENSFDLSFEVLAYERIVVIYSKDSSASSGSDNTTLTNWYFEEAMLVDAADIPQEILGSWDTANLPDEQAYTIVINDDGTIIWGEYSAEYSVRYLAERQTFVIEVPEWEYEFYFVPATEYLWDLYLVYYFPHAVE